MVSATPLRMVNPRGQTLLTKREDDVVNLVVDGLSNRETARSVSAKLLSHPVLSRAYFTSLLDWSTHDFHGTPGIASDKLCHAAE